MRCRLAQIVILDAACFLAGRPVHAQQSAATATPETQAERFCPPSSTSNEEQPSRPEMSVAEVTFSGLLRLSIEDRDQIAASVKERTHGSSLNGVTDEALERVRAGWQNHGYFKAQVSGDARVLTSSPTNQRIALSIYVDEGQQYSLGEITFKNNKAITSAEALRGLFPIKDGDIFDREAIAKGLGNLSFAYGQLGYINFTSIPDATFSQEGRTISLTVDIDEGKQFYVS